MIRQILRREALADLAPPFFVSALLLAALAAETFFFLYGLPHGYKCALSRALHMAMLEEP